MIIYITGFTSCGKSTIGKELAGLLSIEFHDLDQIIEDSLGMTISEYFLKNDELAFRLEEQRALHQFIKSNQQTCILALGGGTMSFSDNCSVILNNGIAVYIKRKLEYFYEHSDFLRNNKPLFKGLSELQTKTKIYHLLNERQAFYAKSQLQTLATSDFSPKKLANILKLLTNRPQSL